MGIYLRAVRARVDSAGCAGHPADVSKVPQPLLGPASPGCSVRRGQARRRQEALTAMAKVVTAQDAARAIVCLEFCPDHPQYLILPWFGMRACCLHALLEKAEGDPERASEILAEARKLRDATGVTRLRR